MSEHSEAWYRTCLGDMGSRVRVSLFRPSNKIKKIILTINIGVITMNISEIIKEYYPHLLPILENVEYNIQKNIAEYFGQDIMVIYNGHGGFGWNIRKLVGIHKNDDRYLVLERVGGKSLIELGRWFLFIVLPENIEKMNKIYHERGLYAPIYPTILNGAGI